MAGFTEPTAGVLSIYGGVQALMQRGYGFNDQLTGIENIRNALIYNGLPDDLLDAAEKDIIDFVELGEFIFHPVKTYSLGMRARLEFAAVTAIQPEILLIDEVLGAGDGYFVHKCANRMRQLVRHTTLVLVSHSLDQIREYCTRVIWLDDGKIREDGPTDIVLSNYRRHMSSRSMQLKRISAPAGSSREVFNTNEKIFFKKIEPNFRKIEKELAVLNGFRFFDNSERRITIETGDSLDFIFSISVTRSVLPAVLGFTIEGMLLFELVTRDILVSGSHELRLGLRKAGIGVGQYFLVPVLRDVKTYELIGFFDQALGVEMSATNWNDPPLLHFDAQWRSSAGSVALNSKISAWV